jgi:hypothetical protein
VYVADKSNLRIRRITSAGVVTTLAGQATSGSTDGSGTNARFTSPWGIALDLAGNMYITDSSRIRRITSLGVVSTLAGSGTTGVTDGTGTNATFNAPRAIAVNSAGNMFVVDSSNHNIRRITSAGVVTTIAGLLAGGGYKLSFADGTGTNAGFYTPIGLAIDSTGNLYVADRDNNRIRKITTADVVTTFAGNGSTGLTDSVQNGAVSGALLNLPRAVAVDSSSTMYVADTTNHRIRKITSAGVVTTLAGSGTAQFADGTGTGASFNSPQGIAVDSAGNVYVGDTLNNRIRKITSAGVVSTLAGSGTAQFGDGNGTSASFNNPYGVTVDSAGIVYVVDKLNYRVRKITSAGVVTTLAGNGTAQYLEGNGTAARFLNPFGIVVNSAGTLMYVTDSNYIRKITSAGVTTFIAGQATAGSTDATGVSASFNGPREIALLAAGTSVYVADTGNHIIRRVTTDFGVTTKYSGFGGAGFRETPVANVQYNTPSGIAVDSAGLVYVADTNNNRIRTIAAGADNTGVVTTVVGTNTAGYTDGGGWFNSPFGVATDWYGTVYVADTTNNRIRKITPAGVVTTFAGNGAGIFNDATGTSASFNQPRGVALGSDGTVYVADTTNNRIRRITFDGVVTIVAGNTSAGSTDGTSTSALFNAPNAITVNSSDIMYVADTGNHRIRAITQARVVTTFAGSSQGFADGVGTNVQFNTPRGIVADIYGNLYVADTNNHRIRRISSDGTVTTLAGSTVGIADGTGTNAKFNFPTHLSIDALGTLYVADQTNNRVRTIQTSTGVVSTLAGTGTAGFTSSQFNSPFGITVERFRQAYVADTGNHSIRKIADVYTLPENNGVTITIAGDGTGAFLDGTGIGASFNQPYGVAVDSAGNMYVADTANHRIRKITPTGVVTTLAGNGTTTFADGVGTNATFNNPSGVAVDSAGNMYVADTNNNRIRKITPAGVVTTLVGSTSGYLDGAGTNARFSAPRGVAVDSAGNVYVADTGNHRIRGFSTPGTPFTYTAAGSTFPGFADGNGAGSTSFSSPWGIAVDRNGIVYVGDSGNNRIRKVVVTNGDGVVTTLAGQATSGSTDGIGTSASFSGPTGVTVDSMGTVYVADANNQRIRKITPAGVVTTLAGNGTTTFANGTRTNATFNNPQGIVVDSAGNVYVADTTNHRIRKIGTNVAQVPLNRGVTSLLAGSGTAAFADGTGAAASFYDPWGVAVDSSGVLFIGDRTNNLIRRITPQGVVTTFAGNRSQNLINGTGTNAALASPRGVAFDSAGNLYVGDTFSNSIRKITPAAVVTTLAGNITGGHADGTGTNARFNQPIGVAVDSAGNVYVGDQSNSCIRRVTPGGVVTTFAGGTGGIAGAFADGTGTNARFSYPQGVAIDSAGNVYVADEQNHRIRKITPLGVVTTLAGNGNQGGTDGTGTNATFSFPRGVAVDSVGNVYVGDNLNGAIRKITPTGVVSTIKTGLNFPMGLTVDAGGIIYVVNSGGQTILKIQ